MVSPKIDHVSALPFLVTLVLSERKAKLPRIGSLLGRHWVIPLTQREKKPNSTTDTVPRRLDPHPLPAALETNPAAAICQDQTLLISLGRLPFNSVPERAISLFRGITPYSRVLEAPLAVFERQLLLSPSLPSDKAPCKDIFYRTSPTVNHSITDLVSRMP